MRAANRNAVRGLLFPDDVKASGGGREGKGTDLPDAPVPTGCHGVVGNTPVGNTPVEFRYQPADGAKPRDMTSGCVALATPEMPTALSLLAFARNSSIWSPGLTANTIPAWQ
ncbi:hypothetical protein ACJ73_05430 [Blastomyces percursus]|uniref:Uncharacterized protein n=1 Tax=Blastomyces percursus TaxID=1658174 RepID=A0A1J9R5D5_9EURO|nr:hypothetical protein ACJ73_05430 [Blastomyces percursus]